MTRSLHTRPIYVKMLVPMELNPAPETSDNPIAEPLASFLTWLSPDREKASIEYLEIRKSLVKYFVRKGCFDAETLASNTLECVYSKSPQEWANYSKPILLCYGVAKNIRRKEFGAPKNEVLENEDIPSPVHYEEDFTDQEINCLGLCLARLSPGDRELITQYHQFQGRQKIETRKQLATLYGGLNKVRITTCRIRARLHDCVSGCVQRSALN